MKNYRLILLGSAAAWVLLGMHLPRLHEIVPPATGHQWMIVVGTAVLAILGTWGLRTLMRTGPARE